MDRHCAANDQIVELFVACKNHFHAASIAHLPAHDTHRENYNATGTLGTVCASRAGVRANVFLKL